MPHYVIGRNLAGYMPESEPMCFGDDWQAAADALGDEMRRYADDDDEGTLAEVEDMARQFPSDYPNAADGDFGDEGPAMVATVGAILADDGPRQVGESWGALVEDGSGRDISFWLAVVPAEECEHEHQDD